MGRVSSVLSALAALAACAPADGPADRPTEPPPLPGSSEAEPLASPKPVGSIAGEWTYAAIGTEPFWSLDVHSIKGGGWSLHRPGEVAAYGSLDSVAAPDAPPALTGRSSDGEQFRLVASAGPCSDGMSERRFAHTVVVALGSLRLNGCGGDVLRPARLEGTS